MDVRRITPDTLRDALRAARYERPLRTSPLVAADAVTLRMHGDGLADSPACREWALRCTLGEVTLRELGRMLGRTELEAACQPAPDVGALLVDPRTASLEPAASLALVYAHYLDAEHMPCRELAARLNVSLRTVTRRMRLGYDLLVAALREAEIAASRRLPHLPAVTAPDRVVVSAGAPRRNGHAAMAALLAAVCEDGPVACLAPDQALEIARRSPDDLVEYRLGLVARWSRLRHRLDDRFVDRTLALDVDVDRSGAEGVGARRFAGLGEALDGTEEPALVVLGPPGSGKSTLLRHFELEAAVAGLRRDARPVTFLVELGGFGAADHRGSTPGPHEWLAARWADRCPYLPVLDDLLSEGRVVLLLDGLDEVAARDAAEHRVHLLSWKRFAHAFPGANAGSRVVFSCRTLDYGVPLSTPSEPVPRLVVEPLDDDQVRAYLRRHVPARADAMWRELAASSALDLARVPFFLRLLVGQAERSGGHPPSPARLITGFVREALRREVDSDNPLLGRDGVLTERDLRRVVHGRNWRTPYDLPSDGGLFPALGDLAWAMQRRESAGLPARTHLDYADALDVLGEDRAATVLGASESLGVLDEDPGRDTIMFVHQTVQEYFAARCLARRPDPSLVRTPWRATEVAPGVDEVIDGLGSVDPLPPLPATGWEETTVLAAEMAADPEAFVAGLIDANLALAGRCAARAEVLGRLGAPLLDGLRRALVRRTRDPAADLRDRIACGLALGDLGDPRLVCRNGPDGLYLLPELVDIPEGTYPVGADEPYELFGTLHDACRPRHLVPVAPFRIGRFAVTNAEWACFMAAGGYEDERWWDGDEARAWRSGVATATAIHAEVRDWRDEYRGDPAQLEVLHSSGAIDDRIHGLWLARLGMSDEAFEEHLWREHPGGRRSRPRFWDVDPFKNPAMPVVGICWYEAGAYDRWLGAQSGVAFRLPTEAEWAAAAHGRTGRIYPWGDEFDRLRTNVVETHVRQPTPVGVFPAGDTPEGVADLAGNAWEWTSSLWGAGRRAPTFRYPYVATDGREDPQAAPTIRRVLRGGSWRGQRARARAATRIGLLPGDRRRDYGLRLAVSGAAPCSPSGR